MALYTKVKGVTFQNNDGIHRQQIISSLSSGDRLVIRNGLDHKYPNSLAVLTANGSRIGSIDKDLAAALMDETASVGDFPAHVSRIIGGGVGKSYGCVISIDLPEELARRVKLRHENYTDEAPGVMTMPRPDLRGKIPVLIGGSKAPITKEDGSTKKKWIISAIIALIASSLFCVSMPPENLSIAAPVFFFLFILLVRLIMALPAAIRMQRGK